MTCTVCVLLYMCDAYICLKCSYLCCTSKTKIIWFYMCTITFFLITINIVVCDLHQILTILQFGYIVCIYIVCMRGRIQSNPWGQRVPSYILSCSRTSFTWIHVTVGKKRLLQLLFNADFNNYDSLIEIR